MRVDLLSSDEARDDDRVFTDVRDVDPFVEVVPRAEDVLAGRGVGSAGGPSRSDDEPDGRAKGRARGGRGVAGRTGARRVGAM